jgi:hypothetical protein
MQPAAICIACGASITSLRRVWDFENNEEPLGPHWEIYVSMPCDCEWAPQLGKHYRVVRFPERSSSRA